MEPLQVIYNFKTLEAMMMGTAIHNEQYLSSGLEVRYQLFIGINCYQAIFVIK